MLLNLLRVLGLKFFTIAVGLNRKFSIVLLSLRIIVIFILKSAMIVLLFDMSFEVHHIARPIWLCMARHSRVLGAQSTSGRSTRAISSTVILSHAYNPRMFG